MNKNKYQPSGVNFTTEPLVEMRVLKKKLKKVSALILKVDVKLSRCRRLIKQFYEKDRDRQEIIDLAKKHFDSSGESVEV